MNKNRRELIMAADKLCSCLVAHSFNYRCILCNLPGSDCHHWRYCRSILVYRFSLENLVFMCRIHHNEAEQNHMALYQKIKRDYPHLWAWGDSRPPLKSEPISTLRIEWILEKLQSTAVAMEVKI